jgi:pilus assembly protein CpaB
VAGISLSRRAIALIVAVVLAAVATVALVSYVQSAHSNNLPHPVTAYVAKEAIAHGTDAATINSKGLIEPKTVDASVVPPGAITSVADIQGKVAAIDIAPNEIILSSRFVAPDQQTGPGTPLVAIPKGFQAMSVEVTSIPGVANFIQPNDKVSILVQLPLATSGGNNTNQVRFLLQNVQVLQVGQRVIVPPANGQPGGAAVQQTAGKVDLTLAVTGVQAEKLAFAVLNGTLYFTLVLPDAKSVPTTGRTLRNEYGR